MSATNTTTHYNLPSFLPADKPAWLVDWNGAMASIDAGIYQAQQTAETAGTDISALQNSLTTLSGTVDSQGVTISTLSQSLTTAIGSINTINSLIGNGTPTTTDQTIIGAINEINARTGDAEGISYDNTDSGLTATNVQSAIDEVNSEISSKLGATTGTNYIELDNGLLICFGRVTTAENTYGNVTLPKSYGNTTYTVIVSAQTDPSGTQMRNGNYEIKSATRFDVRGFYGTTPGANIPLDWVTIGFITTP